MKKYSMPLLSTNLPIDSGQSFQSVTAVRKLAKFKKSVDVVKCIKLTNNE